MESYGIWPLEIGFLKNMTQVQMPAFYNVFFQYSRGSQKVPNVRWPTRTGPHTFCWFQVGFNRALERDAELYRTFLMQSQRKKKTTKKRKRERNPEPNPQLSKQSTKHDLDCKGRPGPARDGQKRSSGRGDGEPQHRPPKRPERKQQAGGSFSSVTKAFCFDFTSPTFSGYHRGIAARHCASPPCSPNHNRPNDLDLF